MDEAKRVLEAIEKIPAALNRIADAGFAIAQALSQQGDEGDEDEAQDAIEDAPRGKGMGMG